MKYHLYFYYFW